MASKKNKDVVRCGICGVKATQTLGTGLFICDNTVCYHETLKQRDELVQNEKKKK
jgi:hypothetical protein